MKRLLAAALLLLAAACSTAPPPPPAPPPLNPVGTFEFQTSVDGNTVTGTAEVTGRDGVYGGVIRTSATPDLPITDVTVEGDTMVVRSTVNGGTLTLRMVFTGDEFTGGWTLPDDSGTLTGRRRPATP